MLALHTVCISSSRARMFGVKRIVNLMEFCFRDRDHPRVKGIHQRAPNNNINLGAALYSNASCEEEGKGF
ncbi:hypothetical protein EYR41_009751 [Orbilia oligospora]|uniref:Uncharacterized protein n=1 Tax=Orbilia oligospora TaxID=2813651 RepID=A0A8H2HLD5_ORBOL|nr:hypothetical protein EYR41_009751 [Orbilia oligospora]